MTQPPFETRSGLERPRAFACAIQPTFATPFCHSPFVLLTRASVVAIARSSAARSTSLEHRNAAASPAWCRAGGRGVPSGRLQAATIAVLRATLPSADETHIRNEPRADPRFASGRVVPQSVIWALYATTDRIPGALEDSGLGARMLLQVHDELIFEVPEAEVDETVEVVSKTMEGAAQLDVPLVVDTGTGPNWDEAH